MSAIRIQKVAILTRVGKKSVDKVCNDILSWFSEHGIEAKMPVSEASVLRKDHIGVPEENLMKDVDLVVVLGGDGTILRAVRFLNGKEIPILGVNFGKFGFLAEVETTQVLDALEKIIIGEFEVEKRMMLNCEIVSKKDSVSCYALNEIFVGRGNAERLFEFDVTINNKFFDRISSDGLIFASPTGSTAYALSAGGPLVSPANQLIIIVPVCPHSLFNRSLVVEKTAEIRVEPVREVSKVSISHDGVLMWDRKPFDHIRITMAEKAACLIRLEKFDFFGILREKLKIYMPLDNKEGGI